MFESLKNKKLLILGCTINECNIVNAAKEMNVYTIVTDNHSDWSDSPAKYIADEAWDVSWSDIEKLTDLCKANHVDGVLAGYSEFKTNCAIQLSHRIGTPFYIEDEEQLKITRDKLLFKAECRKYGVPVAKDYYVTAEMKQEDIDAIEYPVIVKPADNAGSRGIKACYSKENIVDCLQYALSFSESNRVVVEELLQGQFVSLNYTIAERKVTLSAALEKYARMNGAGFGALPDAFLYPSKCLPILYQNYNENIMNLFKGMGLKNGAVGIQGFIKPNGDMVFFEMGYRIGGGNSFFYTDCINHVNNLKMLISYSLTGDMHSEELEKEDAYFKGKYACTLSLLSKDGVIGSMTEDESIQKHPNVIYTCFYHKLGTEIVTDGSQFPITYRCYMVGDSMDEIRDTVKYVQDNVKVCNQSGENMLYPAFDVKELIDYKEVV